ncbi:MAG TPA: hypothetical protein VI699_00055 [Candidatus Acidoferrales bacterium]|nr:hypothetical protein [Candidatus Acidoferrales bacterium]
MGLALVFAEVVFGVGVAQNAPKAEDKDKSCCAQCCCEKNKAAGHTCAMKGEHGKK